MIVIGILAVTLWSSYFEQTISKFERNFILTNNLGGDSDYRSTSIAAIL